MALQAGRVGVAPDQVDNRGNISGAGAATKIKVGNTTYTITRRALTIVDGSTTTTYYVADITTEAT